MPPIPTGFVNQAQLGDVVAQAARQLGPEVVHVAYRLGHDSTGEPSIFFRIVLSDPYIQESTIADLTSSVGSTLFDMVRPIENWGLRPYFNFRSKSEQNRRRDPTGNRWPTTTTCLSKHSNWFAPLPLVSSLY